MAIVPRHRTPDLIRTSFAALDATISARLRLAARAAVAALISARLWLAALAVLFGAVPSGAEPSVDLVGTWHVLVHYRDDHTVRPEQERWEDKVWVFERSGSRLRWTEYPIVVFSDETGRFERRETGQYARVLHAWEPNAKQLADIRRGLEYNTRGSKAKTLRGSDVKGWASQKRAGAASASVITYTETWLIDGMPTRPVFTRLDVMGSARTENVEGVTKYVTVEVGAGGDVLRGTFERDGSRHGTFRMLRAGVVTMVKDRTQSERQREVMGIAADAAGEEGDPSP
ncbi:MAG: hypothetical protein OEM05_12370 [Myxococcales bacterium]|nr:hypothetical protein [Myxococcales bacterium]